METTLRRQAQSFFGDHEGFMRGDVYVVPASNAHVFMRGDFVHISMYNHEKSTILIFRDLELVKKEVYSVIG